jgi:hypothetical protein
MACCVRIRKKKISALPVGQEVSVEDFFELVQEVDGELTNVQITVQAALDFLIENFTSTVSPNLDGDGSPEGVMDAAKNVIYRDNLNDAYYWKTTAAGTLTGWHQFV